MSFVCPCLCSCMLCYLAENDFRSLQHDVQRTASWPLSAILSLCFTSIFTSHRHLFNRYPLPFRPCPRNSARQHLIFDILPFISFGASFLSPFGPRQHPPLGPRYVQAATTDLCIEHYTLNLAPVTLLPSPSFCLSPTSVIYVPIPLPWPS